jgi:superfamily II DNA or RNA helicase
MKLPVSYKTDYGLQGVANSERPLCALMAALVSASTNHCVKELGAVIGCEPLFRHLRDADIPDYRFLQWLAGLTGGRLTPAEHPVVLGKQLSTYQVDTAAKVSVAGGVLNLGCGLGKTLTAIACVEASLNDAHTPSNPSRCWIVCPLNAFGAWRPYVPYLRKLFADVQIISMDSLHKVEGCANIGGCLIFDECHLLGEPDARRTKAAHKIRPMFDFALCLTGTLLHGGVHKALSVLDLAVPGGAVFSSKWKAGEYFKILVKKRIGNRVFTDLARPTGKAKEEFQKYLSRLTIAMTKDSEAVKSEITIPEQRLMMVEIGDCSRDLTELAVEYIQVEMAKEERAGEIPHAMEVAQALCRQGAAEKIDWVLNELDDEPVVIFAQYTETLDAAEERLRHVGVAFVRIDGSVTGRAREAAIATFQSGQAQIVLGQITAAGISADLQRSCVSVAIDHTWRAADYAQALARTCRRGQTHACTHIDLVANKLQKAVVTRLRLATDFDAFSAEWQELKKART